MTPGDHVLEKGKRRASLRSAISTFQSRGKNKCWWKSVKGIGKRHGLRGERQLFLNDDCAPFLLELSENELPPMHLFKASHKLHLYVPSDLSYILACKLIAGRPEKDLPDIEVLCRLLGIQNRAQAQRVVDQYFPSPIHQATYLLPDTLDGIFGK